MCRCCGTPSSWHGWPPPVKCACGDLAPPGIVVPKRGEVAKIAPWPRVRPRDPQRGFKHLANSEPVAVTFWPFAVTALLPLLLPLISMYYLSIIYLFGNGNRSNSKNVCYTRAGACACTHACAAHARPRTYTHAIFAVTLLPLTLLDWFQRLDPCFAVTWPCYRLLPQRSFKHLAGTLAAALT